MVSGVLSGPRLALDSFIHLCIHWIHFLSTPFLPDVVLGFEVIRVWKSHEICAFMEFTFVWGWQGPSTIQKNESAGSSTSVGSFIPVVSTDVISPVGSYSWLQTAVNQHVKSLLKGTQSCLRLWKFQRKRFLSRPGEAVCWQGHPRETLKTPRGECSLTTTLILSSEI